MSVKSRMLLLLYFVMVNYAAQSQELKNLGVDTPWRSGSIVLNDGSELTGQIRYNEFNGAITFKSAYDSDDQRLYQKFDIQSFNFQDNSGTETRKFYILTFNNKKKGAEETDLYEMIREYSEFAVVSKKEKVNVDRVNSNSNPYAINDKSKLIIEQQEHFYFVDPNGNLDLYLTTTSTYVSHDFLYSHQKNRGDIVDKTILNKYLGTKAPAVLQYAKENKFKINNREDLIMALGYYEKLLND